MTVKQVFVTRILMREGFHLTLDCVKSNYYHILHRLFSSCLSIFRYVSEQTCGGVLTNISGVITSPNYPNNYPDNITCTWKIAPEKSHVNLTIEDLMVSGQIKQTSVRR